MKYFLRASCAMFVTFVVSAPAFSSPAVPSISNNPAIRGTDTISAVPGEVLTETSDGEALERTAEANALSVENVKAPGGGNLYLVKSLEGKSTVGVSNILEKNPAIVHVQPNYRYKPLGRITNDRYWPREWWFFDSTDAPGGVNASSAWDLETKKQSDTVVAEIDSGVNMKHGDLKQNLSRGSRKGRSFDNPKKSPTDRDGHGSFVAGIIAAASGNKKGLAGASIGNNLKIMPLQFDFTTAEAIEALNWAKVKGVRIVNASWGGYGGEGNDELLRDAIAGYPGVFVTASGNEGYDHDGADPNQKMYPCDFDLANILCVAASDHEGQLAYYSDYGAASVDVAAPGGSYGNAILSISNSKQRYATGEGSSASTAFVSAEAGLILSKYPHLGTSQVIEIIKNSVDTEPSFAGYILTGGKVNFRKALDLAAGY